VKWLSLLHLLLLSWPPREQGAPTNTAAAAIAAAAAAARGVSNNSSSKCLRLRDMWLCLLHPLQLSWTTHEQGAPTNTAAAAAAQD
jgi:hypothetical protein